MIPAPESYALTGVALDVGLALDLFGRLCGARDFEACARAGRILWQGPASERNVERAGELLLRACEAVPFRPSWDREKPDRAHLQPGSACDSLFRFLNDAEVPASMRRALRNRAAAACRDGNQDVCTLVHAMEMADANRGR